MLAKSLDSLRPAASVARGVEHRVLGGDYIVCGSRVCRVSNVSLVLVVRHRVLLVLVLSVALLSRGSRREAIGREHDVAEASRGADSPRPLVVRSLY